MSAWYHLSDTFNLKKDETRLCTFILRAQPVHSFCQASARSMVPLGEGLALIRDLLPIFTYGLNGWDARFSGKMQISSEEACMSSMS